MLCCVTIPTVTAQTVSYQADAVIFVPFCNPERFSADTMESAVAVLIFTNVRLFSEVTYGRWGSSDLEQLPSGPG